jgi:chaperonin GroES
LLWLRKLPLFGKATPYQPTSPQSQVGRADVHSWEKPFGYDPAKEPKMADTKSRPRRDRVEAEAKTKGGIIIPDTAKEKPQEGEIVAVSSGARDESGKVVALDVKAGDRVLFGKWLGTEVKINDEDLLIMKEADIMGVIG